MKLFTQKVDGLNWSLFIKDFTVVESTIYQGLDLELLTFRK